MDSWSAGETASRSGSFAKQGNAPNPAIESSAPLSLLDGTGATSFSKGSTPRGSAVGRGPSAEMEQLAEREERTARETGAFDPSGIIDARERVVAQIVRRRGQPEFRRALLHAYGRRCAISGCDATEALEASHLSPTADPTRTMWQMGFSSERTYTRSSTSASSPSPSPP